ncbi:MAG: AAA family ATPase, partial [Lactobacillus iners]|nr:AAA family ATPase [Lactobacillus iners]
MPLKQLVLNGFKSFADKTTINFNKGITGIVGPNGSGKSNVTEAIRWVMGENSAKALRGENMRDIIFAGSEFRGPLNKAEVCLIFDNHDRQLHLDSDKVAIMRRILRSGDSEYFINNQSVRLKDIRTLFVDSGLSQNSLAIISQGKVDQILNSQAEDRRYIFEEAAGVLHFKQQKLVALKKLDETNNNLIRINDLVKELKARVEPLSEESSLAKQYKFEKKQLDRKLKQLLALEIESLVLEKKEIGSKLSDSKTNLDRIDEEVSRSQKDLETKKKKSKLLHEQKDDHQSALLHITQEIAQLSTELQIQKQSFEYDAATAKEFEQQHQELIVRKNKLQQILINQQNDLAQVTNNAQQLADFKKKLGSKLNTTPNELNRNLELVRSDYIQTLQDQTTNNNQQVFLKNEIQRLTRAEDNQVASLSEQVQQSLVKLHQLLQDKKNLTQQHEELAAKNNQKTKECNLISQHSQKLQEQINHLQNILSQRQAQIDGLKKLQQRHDGYYT